MLLLLSILFCFNNRGAVSTCRIDVIGRRCLNLLQELLLSGFIYILLRMLPTALAVFSNRFSRRLTNDFSISHLIWFYCVSSMSDRLSNPLFSRTRGTGP